MRLDVCGRKLANLLQLIGVTAHDLRRAAVVVLVRAERRIGRHNVDALGFWLFPYFQLDLPAVTGGFDRHADKISAGIELPGFELVAGRGLAQIRQLLRREEIAPVGGEHFLLGVVCQDAIGVKQMVPLDREVVDFLLFPSVFDRHHGVYKFDRARSLPFGGVFFWVFGARTLSIGKKPNFPMKQVSFRHTKVEVVTDEGVVSNFFVVPRNSACDAEPEQKALHVVDKFFVF